MEKWYFVELLKRTNTKIESYNNQIDSIEDQLIKLYDEIDVLDYFIKNHKADISAMQNHTLQKLRYDKSQEKEEILLEKRRINIELDKVFDIRNEITQELNGDDSENENNDNY